MGLFENKDYFEPVTKLSHVQESAETNENLKSCSNEDLRLEHKIPLSTNPYDSSMIRSSVASEKSKQTIRKKDTLNTKVLKITITTLVGAMIVQTINMFGVLESVLHNWRSWHHRHRQHHERPLSDLEKLSILGILLVGLLFFVWLLYTVWTKTRPFLSLCLNVIQLICFFAVPIVYFNPHIHFRQCHGKFDCMRYTVPIISFISTDVLLIVALFLLFIKKKHRHLIKEPV